MLMGATFDQVKMKYMKGKGMSLWELTLGLLCTVSFFKPFMKAGHAFPIPEPLWTTPRDLGQP